MSVAKGTIVVTGANGGLGSALAKTIASSPELTTYHGIYTVRDAHSAPDLFAAMADGRASHPYDILSVDLSNLDTVRKAAETINARVDAGEIPPIRVLILNAGFQDFGKQVWTDDGLDVTFTANYLGHWLLTLLLLKSMDKESGRIVLVGSQSHESPFRPRNKSAQAFDNEKYRTIVEDEVKFEAITKGTWSSAQDDPSFRSGFRRYGAAKLFLIMMQHELQRRMDQDPALKKVAFVGVDPGTMSTGLQRHAIWFIRVFLFQFVYPIIAWLNPMGAIRSTERSASDVLWAGLDSGPPLGPSPKDLYFNSREPLETSAESRDVQKRDLVWKETVKYAKLKEGETILERWQ